LGMNIGTIASTGMGGDRPAYLASCHVPACSLLYPSHWRFSVLSVSRGWKFRSYRRRHASHRKGESDRHDFAEAQAALPIASLQATTKQLLLPEGFKALAKVIDGAKQLF